MESRKPSRAEQAFLDVLPPAARMKEGTGPSGPDFILGNQEIEVKWIGEGNLGDVRRLLEKGKRPNVVIARQMSPGARNALAQAGISWVDETGAAEVALGSIIVSKSGHAAQTKQINARWTPATLAVAESLLCGTKATVQSTQETTGLSTGSCANALNFLTDLELLEADAARGRRAGRRIRDQIKFLMAYAEAAEALNNESTLQIGVTWRDPVSALIKAGQEWTSRGVIWCATGAVGAAVMAPYLTTVGISEVYIDTSTVVGLEAAANELGLRPLKGGRLILRSMPTVSTPRLATEIEGLRVAPWPRIYVDLRNTGVRGEEAAEHLLEVINARGT